MKPLVIIPARGGSKGVPRKNIKLLNNKPLIHWTIDEARKIFSDDLICVSTDDPEIKDVVENIGLSVPFLRPADLAVDSAGTYEVLLHAVDWYEKQGYLPEVVILLQPTSPFRLARHIQEACQLFSNQTEMVISVKETKANPYYILMEEDEAGYLQKSKKSDATRRQDVPNVWELNGAVYIISVDALKAGPITQFSKVRKYVMDEISSHDIDTQLDWIVAEAIAGLNETNSVN